MDRNILESLVVDNTWLDQCFQYLLDFRPRMTPKLCSTTEKEKFYHGLYKSQFNISTYSWSFLYRDPFNVFFKFVWHFVWQFFGFIVKLGNPSINFVQLQEDAWGTTMIIVVVFLSARWPIFDIHITYLTSRWWRSVVTVVDILTTTRCQSRRFVNWNFGSKC